MVEKEGMNNKNGGKPYRITCSWILFVVLGQDIGIMIPIDCIPFRSQLKISI